MNEKMKNKIDYFEIILKIFILFGVVLIVYWFFQLMFGGSPSIEQFNMGFIFMLV